MDICPRYNVTLTGLVCGDICLFVIWEAAMFGFTAQLLCFPLLKTLETKCFDLQGQTRFFQREENGVWYQESRRRVCWGGCDAAERMAGGPTLTTSLLVSLCSTQIPFIILIAVAFLSSCSLCFQPFCEGVKVLYLYTLFLFVPLQLFTNQCWKG